MYTLPTVNHTCLKAQPYVSADVTSVWEDHLRRVVRGAPARSQPWEGTGQTHSAWSGYLRGGVGVSRLRHAVWRSAYFCFGVFFCAMEARCLQSRRVLKTEEMKSAARVASSHITTKLCAFEMAQNSFPIKKDIFLVKPATIWGRGNNLWI